MNVQEVTKIIKAYHSERLCTKHFFVQLLDLGFSEQMSLNILNTELQILRLKSTDLETLNSPVVLDHESDQCYWSEEALEQFKNGGGHHKPHKKHKTRSDKGKLKTIFSHVDWSKVHVKRKARRTVKTTRAGSGQEDSEDKALKELYDSRREPSHTGIYRSKNDPHFRLQNKGTKKD